jgi:hypothetical protein
VQENVYNPDMTLSCCCLSLDGVHVYSQPVPLWPFLWLSEDKTSQALGKPPFCFLKAPSNWLPPTSTAPSAALGLASQR